MTEEDQVREAWARELRRAYKRLADAGTGEYGARLRDLAFARAEFARALRGGRAVPRGVPEP